MNQPPTHNDDGQSSSWLQSMKDNSLRTAGYAYLVGDAALAAASIARGEYKEARAGALWAVGGLAAARYGNPEKEKMLEILSSRLGDYLKSENITIPENPDTKSLTKKQGIIDHIETFLYSHPSEMLNAAYAIGGTQLIMSGLNKNSTANKWTAASGALVVAGALAGLLIKEKEPDPHNPPKGIIGKATSWIQENPLRLSGALYTMNNASLAMSGIQDYKKHPGNPSAALKFLTVGSYIFGNGMLSLSSKGHADNKQEGQQATAELTKTVAKVIAAQPQQMQNALIEQISGYLAAQPETQMKAGEIKQLLTDKLSQLSVETTDNVAEENSWQQRISQSQDSPSPAL